MGKQKQLLKLNTTINSVTGTSYKVLEYLQNGTQGEIYKIKSSSGNVFALKVYYPHFAQTEDFLTDVSRLTTQKSSPAPNFVWPREMVNTDGIRGYIMDYADLSKTKLIFEDDVLLERDIACKVAISIARCMQALHINGMCYRDLSPNNFEFDQVTGEVIIFDCDNINPKGQKCTVSGTAGYRAPQIVNGQSYPDDFSDIYSMATIFFKMWLGWDCAPLEGATFYNKFDGILDNGASNDYSEAEKYLYGTNPLFIFDPHDKTNALDENDPDQAAKIAIWKYFTPDSLKELFTQTFTVGLKNPSLRPFDGRWVECFSEILRGIKQCPYCLTKNTQESLYCIDCLAKIDKVN